MKKIDGTDLSKPEVGRITDLYRTRGATPDTVKRVASTWQIAESDARTLGIAATTTAPKKAVTESAPDLGAAASTTDVTAESKGRSRGQAADAGPSGRGQAAPRMLDPGTRGPRCRGRRRSRHVRRLIRT